MIRDLSFESVIIGRDLLKWKPTLTAEQFYAEQLVSLGMDDGAGPDMQSAFDTWYAVGLIEYVQIVRDAQRPLTLNMTADLSLQEARTHCLNSLCTRIERMSELLLVLDSITHPTTMEIQRALFGSEQAGFDVVNRLILFQSFGAVRRDRDEWHLAQPGYTILAANPPQELPDFGEMIPENRDDTVITNWDDDLVLLDL